MEDVKTLSLEQAIRAARYAWCDEPGSEALLLPHVPGHGGTFVQLSYWADELCAMTPIADTSEIPRFGWHHRRGCDCEFCLGQQS